MKTILVVVLGVSLSVLCLQSVSAWPSPEELKGQQAVFEAEVAAPVGPQGETVVVESGTQEQEPRFTCSLPGPLGDAACTGHCKLKGFKSGWCDSAKVCHCKN